MSRVASVFHLAKEKFKDDSVMEFARAAVDEARREKFKVAGEGHYHWNRRMLMYYGKDKQNVNPMRMRPKTNRLFIAGEFQRAIMYDHLPFPEFTARNLGRDMPSATLLNDISRFIGDVSNFKIEAQAYFNNLIVFGTGVMEILYDFDALNGFGMVSWKAIDPRHVFVNPGATSFDNASYVITVGSVDIDTAISMFPDEADEISSDFDLMKDSKVSNLGLFARRPGDLSSLQGTNEELESDAGARSIEVLNIYARVPPVPALFSDEEKIDNRIRVMTIVGGKIIAKNDYLPFSHGRMPFISSQCRFFANRIWGISDLEIAEANQQELDRYDDKRNFWNELSYKPWIIKSRGIGLSADEFQTGKDVLEVDAPELIDAVKWFTPPPGGRALAARRDEIIQEINEEIGSISLPSNTEIKNVQPLTLSRITEASEQPVRMKLQMAQPAFKDAWWMALRLFSQHYTGSFSRYFDSEEESIAAIETMEDSRFIVNMGITANTPLSRSTQFSDMVVAANAGVFNLDIPLSARQDLLEASNWPSKKAIIEEMIQIQQQQQAMAEAQQQAEQAQQAEIPQQEAPLI